MTENMLGGLPLICESLICECKQYIYNLLVKGALSVFHFLAMQLCQIIQKGRTYLIVWIWKTT